MEEICNKKDCTGCFACYNACPKNAIEMKEDEYGRIYPVIDQEKCINCGLCKKTCPQLNPVSFREPITAYAMYNKNSDIRQASTSGAAATTFYMKILNEGGVVYGANNIENGKFQFIRITNADDLYKIKGSKYVHCYIEDNYTKVKQDLTKGLKVLFIGTPCQVAGLRAFLVKDYDNLLTVDLVCHGVPPQKMLKEETELHDLDINEIEKVIFRENGYNLKLFKENECVFEQEGTVNYFLYRFMKSMFLRDNCYSCKYTQKQRVSDITIGDFWGLKSERDEFKDENKGISLVMPNTEKGKKFVAECLPNMKYEERSVEEAVKGNSQLRHPTPRTEEYEKFMKLYKTFGYEKACKKTRTVKQILKSIKVINYTYKKIKGR